jgi:hypothetical protein
MHSKTWTLALKTALFLSFMINNSTSELAVLPLGQTKGSNGGMLLDKARNLRSSYLN